MKKRFYLRGIGCASQITFTIFALMACGGGGDGNVTASDSQIVANVTSSNIDFAPSGRPAGTWRWTGAVAAAPSIPVYLPSPANATESDYATKVRSAVGVINSRLGGSAVLVVVGAVPSTKYIRVGYGTAFVPPGPGNAQSYCANVSTGPYLSEPILPSANNDMGSNPVWLNLGNGQCDLTQAIVEHEFGHALGLADHFEGFGNGPATSSAYWDTLRTLYANPVSTVSSALMVQRAGR